MPNMLDMFKDEKEVGMEVDRGTVGSTQDNSNFPENLKVWTRRIVNDYTRYKIDLNKAIAAIAQQNNLNTEQIHRIVEEVNTQIYLIEYSKQKDSMTRDIDFEIADVQKVKDLAGTNIKANQQPTKDPEVEGEKATMQKKASWDGDGDALSFLNHTAYTTANLSVNTNVDENSILRNKVAEKVASVKNEYESAFRDFAVDCGRMANALIKYAQLNEDHQHIFKNACEDSGLGKKSQLFIKEIIINKIASLKEVKKLPENFTCDIELVDHMEKSAGFSLGQHSLIKNAEQVDGKYIPPVETDGGVIKDYKDLIQLATKIQREQGQLSKKQSEKDKIENILQAQKN